MNKKFVLNLVWHCFLMGLVGFSAVFILLNLTGFERPIEFHVGWSLSALFMAGFGTLPFIICYRAATGKWFAEYFWLLWTLWAMIMFLALPGTYVTQKMQEVEDNPMIKELSQNKAEVVRTDEDAAPAFVQQDPIDMPELQAADLNHKCEAFIDGPMDAVNIERAKKILEVVEAIPMPCSEDAECVAVARACGGHRAVLQTYEECLGKAAMQYGSLLNCAKVTWDEPISTCHQGECQLHMPATEAAVE